MKVSRFDVTKKEVGIDRFAEMGSRAEWMVVVMVIMVALLFPKATAFVFFRNRGILSGWDTVIADHYGSVEEVTGVTFKGNTSLRFTQVYDGGYTGPYRSQVGENGAYQRGDSGFYGFAFRLKPDWEFTSQRFDLVEFIADVSDNACVDGGQIRSSRLWLVGDKLYSQVKTGPVCDPTTTVFPNLATVSAGVWHTVIIRAIWKSGSTGEFEIWLDGTNVLQQYNIPTTLFTDRAFQFRIGLVATGWRSDGTLVGSQSTRRVWFDQIRFASTYTDVEPATWT